MVRAPSYDSNGVKKGIWSQEEDEKLKCYIQRYGHWNWLKLPRFAGLSRTGKSCRLRWMNYLRPNVKRGNYTREEDELIIKLQEELGNKWCVIASKLPGRTDNEIKNHWHTKLKKKRVSRNTAASEEEKDQSIETYEFEANQNKEGQEPKTVFVDDASLNILESSKMSLEPYSSILEPSLSSDQEFSSAVNLAAAIDSVASSSDIFEFTGDFWTEPFLPDNFYQYGDFPSTIADTGEFTFPCISAYSEDLVDLFYLMVKDFPDQVY